MAGTDAGRPILSIMFPQFSGKVRYTKDEVIQMAFPMPKIADPSKSGDKTYSPCPEGLFSGVLVRVYYVGSHKPKTSKFGDKPPAPMVILVFELDEPDEEGKNRLVSVWLNLFTGEKASLTKLLKPWLGSKFPKIGEPLDLPAIVGMPAMVTITHNRNGDKVYSNITGLAPIMRGMQPLVPTTKPFAWAMGDTITEDIPQYVLDKCDQSAEATGGMMTQYKTAADIAARVGGPGTTKLSPQPAFSDSDDDEIPY